MDEQLQVILDELERFGSANDATAAKRAEKMLNITRDTGTFLALLIQAVKARRILEIGTSNGYSALWLADAARRVDGTVTTLELLPAKADMALANFRRAGLADRITLRLGDAGEHLRAQADGAYDLIFLDSDRTRYTGWWPDLQRVLQAGSLIIVDNAVDHAAELQEFAAIVALTPGYATSLVPIGNGELLILKQP